MDRQSLDRCHQLFAELLRYGYDGDRPKELCIGAAEAGASLLAEIERLRATMLNIQAAAERGNPIDLAKLATQCRHALNQQIKESS